MIETYYTFGTSMSKCHVKLNVSMANFFVHECSYRRFLLDNYCFRIFSLRMQSKPCMPIELEILVLEFPLF
jgi:hypothetical protein